MRSAFNLLVLPNSMSTPYYIWKGYVLSAEIALKNNHYYYYHYPKFLPTSTLTTPRYYKPHLCTHSLMKHPRYTYTQSHPSRLDTNAHANTNTTATTPLPQAANTGLYSHTNTICPTSTRPLANPILLMALIRETCCRIVHIKCALRPVQCLTNYEGAELREAPHGNLQATCHRQLMADDPSCDPQPQQIPTINSSAQHWFSTHRRHLLQDFLKKNKINVSMTQATKPGHKDLTTLTEGHDHIRQDRQGSSMIHHDLMASVWQGIQYRAQNCVNPSPLECQKVIIHMTCRRQFLINNVLMPPHSSNYTKIDNQSRKGNLPTNKGIIFGDLNAHQYTWDMFADEDSHGTTLLEDNTKATLIDGSPTRVGRCQQRC